jgi:hypothetical protein
MRLNKMDREAEPHAILAVSIGVETGLGCQVGAVHRMVSRSAHEVSPQQIRPARSSGVLPV